MERKLTIGMATYDDYSGTWFTVQSLRMHHPESKDAEILVLDNNPYGEHGNEVKMASKRCGFRYETYVEKKSTSCRNEIFKRASGKYVIVLDCHVLLMSGAISALLKQWESDPESKDILSGPMMNDELKSMNTEFQPNWRGFMYGTWGCDPRGMGEDTFEIPMMGLGAFACRKEAWPGLNEHFVGFGGEEGYIHEKFRLKGGRALCVPGFKWAHRFGKPGGCGYPMRLEDRAWNYIVGWMELYRNPEHEVIKGCLEHFKDHVSNMTEMVDKAKNIYGVHNE